MLEVANEEIEALVIAVGAAAPEAAAKARQDSGGYFPWYFGGRPSASARRPSRKSSVR